MGGHQVAEQFQDYIVACAAHFCKPYDDREELASHVVLSLLQYDKPIFHLRTFIRVTTKNLALNSLRVGAGLWETVESKLADSADYQGLEQEDLPKLIGISKQAVSKVMASIRRKYLALEREDEGIA